ncbi:MAG: hypothetical protein F4X97_07340 [Boseongicola sp. SB0662_bin_57]|nr:hypothetical protein [Boseongicola sp. SB0662_bin_57]
MRRFALGSVWSVLGAGRRQPNFVAKGAILGGNVCVGPGDSACAGKGQFATSSAEQVRVMRTILESLSTRSQRGWRRRSSCTRNGRTT